MKYKSKKDRSQTISILARDWNRNGGAFLKTIITPQKVPLVSNTVNITMNRLGHFYICVPIPLDVIDKQEDVKGKIKLLVDQTRGKDTVCYARVMKSYCYQNLNLQTCKGICELQDNCTEEYKYTSKTCGNCGFIKKNLGESKTFRCDSCDLVIDRDVNGARNILLKH
ncbi:hypothetical protein Glove_341g17 [Diversispora epigaea]|uniref:Cas12f1-like TNB domain-containing protein n=1 Tax=Diversispora epigaea TaxID=1348612 RepID=A0A397HP32_9GLOM|nr:hypothetical protein Glove_341g17 [Diversispora epigaea]